MNNNFSTRCLKMSYKFCANNKDSIENSNNALNVVLSQLFGTGYRMTKSSCLIYVPITCNYFIIVNTLRNEFGKQLPLKGMSFRVDLRERMKEI